MLPWKFASVNEALFDLVVHSVGVSEHGHYTAQAEESVLNSGATKTHFSF